MLPSVICRLCLLAAFWAPAPAAALAEGLKRVWLHHTGDQRAALEAAGLPVQEERTCAKWRPYQKLGSCEAHTLYLAYLYESLELLGLCEDPRLMAIVERVTKSPNLASLLVRAGSCGTCMHACMHLNPLTGRIMHADPALQPPSLAPAVAGPGVGEAAAAPVCIVVAPWCSCWGGC